MLFLAHAYGLPIDKSWIGKGMREHSFRHGIAILTGLVPKLLPALNTLEASNMPEGRAVGELFAPLRNLDEISSIAEELIDTDEEIAWWSEADELKQAGLYVDWNGANWASPQQCTKSHYELALTHAYRMLRMLHQLEEWSNPADADYKTLHTALSQHMDEVLEMWGLEWLIQTDVAK